THKIDIAGAAPNQIATVYDGDWFFASNDLVELKAVLDRADGRAKDPKLELETEETFRAALAHMPSSYGLLSNRHPKMVSAGISSTPKAAYSNIRDDARAALEQLQSVCGAAKFESGKVRDVLFVGAPRMRDTPELTRSSLKLGTADTFLYVVALLNPDRLGGVCPGGEKGPPGRWVEKDFDVSLRPRGNAGRLE